MVSLTPSHLLCIFQRSRPGSLPHYFLKWLCISVNDTKILHRRDGLGAARKSAVCSDGNCNSHLLYLVVRLPVKNQYFNIKKKNLFLIYATIITFPGFSFHLYTILSYKTCLYGAFIQYTKIFPCTIQFRSNHIHTFKILIAAIYQCSYFSQISDVFPYSLPMSLLSLINSFFKMGKWQW